MGQQKRYGIQWGQMLSPASEKEGRLAVVQAGDGLAGEQLHWEGPVGHVRQQTEHEPAMRSGSTEGQQHPGLY